MELSCLSCLSCFSMSLQRTNETFVDFVSFDVVVIAKGDFAFFKSTATKSQQTHYYFTDKNRHCQINCILEFTNFTMQSIQVGLPVTSSMNTLAGCMSSKTNRSEI